MTKITVLNKKNHIYNRNSRVTTPFVYVYTYIPRKHRDGPKRKLNETCRNGIYLLFFRILCHRVFSCTTDINTKRVYLYVMQRQAAIKHKNSDKNPTARMENPTEKPGGSTSLDILSRNQRAGCSVLYLRK